jgi:hypothetical protein
MKRFCRHIVYIHVCRLGWNLLPRWVEVLHEIDDLVRSTRIAPEGGDGVELRYREVFTSPSDLHRLEITSAAASGEVRSTIFDTLDRFAERRLWNVGLGDDGIELSADGYLCQCSIGHAARPCIGDGSRGGVHGLTRDAPSRSIDALCA